MSLAQQRVHHRLRELRFQLWTPGNGVSFPLATSLGSPGMCKMPLKPTDRSWGWAMLPLVIGPPSQTFDQHVTLYYEGSRNCPVLSGHCVWAECVCLCVCMCLHMHVHIYMHVCMRTGMGWRAGAGAGHTSQYSLEKGTRTLLSTHLCCLPLSPSSLPGKGGQ